MLSRPNTKVIAIDTGIAVPQSVAQDNVAKNSVNKDFHYIEANSQIQSTKDKVKQLTDKVDILFIDGDHSRSGVIKDWNLYNTLVKKNGYVVFDDYNCPQSIGVKEAVTFITEQDKFDEYYLAIGTIENSLGARGFSPDFKDGNCFIMRKLK